jgi:hypothetical protein
MMYGPFESMMSWMWPMGPEWAIVMLVVLTLATGALVLVTHHRRSLDGPPRTG